MHTWLANAWSLGCRFAKLGTVAAVLMLLTGASAFAEEAGGESGPKAS